MLNNLSEFKDGMENQVFLMVKNCSKDVARNGSEFQKAIVVDLSGKEYGMMIFQNLINFTKPVVLKATVRCSLYKNVLSFDMLSSEETTDYKLVDFIPSGNVDVKDTWQKLMSYVGKLSSSEKMLICEILKEHQNKFVSMPLDIQGAFSYKSGLLDATYKLTKHAYEYALEEGLDTNLVIISSILYYIGKVKTISDAMTYEPLDVLINAGVTSYTMIENKAKELRARDDANIDNDENKDGTKEAHSKFDIDDETLGMIYHIILCQNKSVISGIPEAVVLKMINKINLEVEGMKMNLKGNENGIVNSTNTYAKRLYARKKEKDK